MSKSKNVGCLAGMLPSIIVIVLIIGWIQCIYKDITSDWNPVGKREVFYTLGVCIPPAGGVIGWFNIEDKPLNVIQYESQ